METSKKVTLTVLFAVTCTGRQRAICMLFALKPALPLLSSANKQQQKLIKIAVKLSEARHC